jgi:hypothetical protein
MNTPVMYFCLFYIWTMIEVLACEYWYWQILIKQLHRVQANIRGVVL